MDMVKMGSFLAELRKEQKLTQAELGEKLGVTNKTVSRWGTGTYMPPVEILEELSRLYGLTINEILSGRKLTTEEYKEMAELNIRETLKASTFELKEKQEFFKKKWRREHISTIIACTVACNGVQREHNKKLNNGLPILHKVPPKRDYGRYFCIMAEKGGTSHGGLTEKLSLFFHAKKQEVNAYGR